MKEEPLEQTHLPVDRPLMTHQKKTPEEAILAGLAFWWLLWLRLGGDDNKTQNSCQLNFLDFSIVHLPTITELYDSKLLHMISTI